MTRRIEIAGAARTYMLLRAWKDIGLFDLGALIRVVAPSGEVRGTAVVAYLDRISGVVGTDEGIPLASQGDTIEFV